jgi:hypothetical protein
MNENEPMQVPSLGAIAAGAAIGALAIYVLRTDQGRKLLNQAITLIDDFSTECARFRQSVTRAQFAVSDSWQAVKNSTTSNTGGGRETVF